MPRIIDRESRRREVIHAVWRIIVADGIAQASFRAIADETGLAIGSIRHYFGSHEDLIVAAAQELSDRVAERLEATVARTDPGPKRAQDVLELLVPLDRERHEEAILWLSILTEARLNPALAGPASELFNGVEQVVRLVLADTEYANDEVEIERMCALLDGLAARAAVQPDAVPPHRIRAVLERHLASLRPQPLAPN